MVNKYGDLTALFDNLGGPPRWNKSMLQTTLQEIYPTMNIRLDFRPLQYENSHSQFLKAMRNKKNLDILDIV